MKTIICGSRSFGPEESKRHVREAVERVPWTVHQVYHGCADGIDKAADRWAHRHDIDVERFPITDYTTDTGQGDPTAGPRRNADMADEAEACIAIWDGESGGTKDMIEKARRAGLKVSVYQPHLEEKQEGLF